MSISNTMRYGRQWAIGDPSFRSDNTVELEVYEVQKGEDMRIDLVIKSIYGEDSGDYYKDCDIILYINNIDNPLNIREGMKLLYPPSSTFDSFRYVEDLTPARKRNVSVKERLGVLNKTTRKDEKRKKFLESNYSLPPTVLKESRPGVVVTANEILVGGI